MYLLQSSPQGPTAPARGRPRTPHTATFSMVEFLLAIGVIAIALGAAPRAAGELAHTNGNLHLGCANTLTLDTNDVRAVRAA